MTVRSDLIDDTAAVVAAARSALAVLFADEAPGLAEDVAAAAVEVFEAVQAPEGKLS